jgi:hypothetical protein
MMARKRGVFGKIFVIGTFALALFGGYTLYKGNQKQVNDISTKAYHKAKAVGEALKN